MKASKNPQSAPSARVPAQAATWLSIDDIHPNPRNPRMHGPEVMNLARTIVRTTWGAPIVVQKSTMMIIAGHGRLEAAREILAGIEVDGFQRGGDDYYFDRDAPGPGLVPVRIVDVSDAEAAAMTLADNARRLQGTDDAALVVAMAANFERDAPVMQDLGLSAEELDKLVKNAGDAALGNAKTAASDASSRLGATVFRVIVLCDGEQSQASLIERLELEGFECQPLIS